MYVNQYSWITPKLEVSREEADLVCKATRGQSHNKIWKKTRTYVLTASNFGIVCKRKETTLPDDLIKFQVYIMVKNMKQRLVDAMLRSISRLHLLSCTECTHH